MKVALLTDGIWPFFVGGMQKHSYNLCKYLCASGIKVTLFHPALDTQSKEKLQNLFSEAELQNLEWVDVPRIKKYRFFGHYLYESYLFSKNCYTLLQDQNDFDFIYAKGLTSWYVLTKKQTIKCPIGIKIHGYEFMQVQPNPKEKLSAIMLYPPFKYIHRRADYIFSYGANITKYIRKLGVPNQKIVEISGAVDVDWVTQARKNRVPRRGKKFLFIGRYERRKGVEEINTVLTQYVLPKDSEFHFVGPIPDEQKVDTPGVRYHGLITDKNEIIDILDKCDILVCPSHSEGMPNVIMEAMSRGCAIIATNVGAVPLLVDQANGWLINPASVNELEKAMHTAGIMDYSQIELMGEASIRRIREKFTWPVIINSLIDKIYLATKA